MSIFRRDWSGWAFVGLWTVSMGIQLLLAGAYAGYVGDQMTFWSWMRTLQQVGLAHIYQSHLVNYPPVYLAILDVYGWVAHALDWQVVPGGLFAKLPGIALDGGAMVAFFRLSRGISQGWRWAMLIFFCWNPAILFDTAVWGQVDILDAILAAIAVAQLGQSRMTRSGATFSLAILSKFQSIVVFPVMAVQSLRAAVEGDTRHGMWRLALGLAIPLAVVGVYFTALGGSVPALVHQAYVATTSQYPYVNVNAMNIWFYLIGTAPRTPDTAKVWGMVSYKLVGLLLLTFAVLYIAAYLWRHRLPLPEALMKASTLIAFSFFLLPTEIHERYSIMAVVFCLFAALYDRQWAWLAGGLSLTAFWNLWVVVYSSPNPTTDMWMVYLNLVLYAAMVILMGRELRASTRIADRPWPNRGGLEGKSPDPFNAKRSRG